MSVDRRFICSGRLEECGVRTQSEYIDEDCPKCNSSCTEQLECNEMKNWKVKEGFTINVTTVVIVLILMGGLLWYGLS